MLFDFFCQNVYAVSKSGQHHLCIFGPVSTALCDAALAQLSPVARGLWAAAARNLILVTLFLRSITRWKFNGTKTDGGSAPYRSTHSLHGDWFSYHRFWRLLFFILSVLGSKSKSGNAEINCVFNGRLV